jgi:hypothetical protein
MSRARVLPANPDPFTLALEEGYHERIARLRAEATALIARLTPWQAQILRGFGLGLCDKEIAQRGGWSLNSVGAARCQMSRRIHVYGRVALMRLALRGGLVSIWCEGETAYSKRWVRIGDRAQGYRREARKVLA